MDGRSSYDLAPSVGGDDTRDLIVARAMELFAHYGYSKTNLGDIAQECRMSTSNLYNYFKNKQAIGHAVVRVFFEAEDHLIEPIVVDPVSDAETRLRTLVTTSVMHTVEHLRQNPKIVELAEMLCETDEGLEMIRQHVDQRKSALAEIIRQGVAAGDFRVDDPERAARAVQMGTKFFHVPIAIARHGLDQVEEDLGVTLDLLCAGLRRG